MPTLWERINRARKSKSFMTRLLVAIIIGIVLLYLYWGLWKRGKQVLIWTWIVAAGALWLQVFDYDLDLAKLWETGSIQSSRIENKKWVRLTGKCVSDDLNCANFSTQDEAQALYEECATQIEANNKEIEDAKRIDVYGLDGDKDGIVCEHLASAG